MISTPSQQSWYHYVYTHLVVALDEGAALASPQPLHACWDLRPWELLLLPLLLMIQPLVVLIVTHESLTLVVTLQLRLEGRQAPGSCDTAVLSPYSVVGRRSNGHQDDRPCPRETGPNSQTHQTPRGTAKTLPLKRHDAWSAASALILRARLPSYSVAACVHGTYSKKREGFKRRERERPRQVQSSCRKVFCAGRGARG